MSRRRGGFRIADGLVAVALVAVSLVWARAYWGETVASMPGWNWGYDTTKPFFRSPAYISGRSTMLVMAYVGTTLAAPWGVAMVLIRRVRRPKSPFWRARKPGAVACLTASGVFFTVLTMQAVWPWQDIARVLIGPHGEFRIVVTPPLHDPPFDWEQTDPFLNTALQLPRMAGFLVAGAWTALALGGRWRPERTWGDRLGRLIGLFWIVASVHFLFFPI